MAKEDFCFTYYDGDAARDTTHMNRLERGAYHDIIISQRKFGHLTFDQIRKILGRDFTECWNAIQLIMKVDADEKFYIEWLDNSLLKMRAHSKKQSENRKNKTKSEPNSTKQQPNNNQREPLEDGYGNGDGIENKKEPDEFFIEVEKLTDRVKIIEAIMTDEIYIEQLQSTHRGKDIKKAFEECYIHHSNAPNPPATVGEWRQKLNTWLINTKNGTSKTNRGDAVNARREAFARKHGTSTGN